MKKYPTTKEGLEKKKQELSEIVNVLLPNIINDVKDARAQGDLSENADYQFAREKQRELEARRDQLREEIDNAEIISVDDTDEVKLGSFVTLFLGFKNKEEEYHIVGSTEANPIEYKISNDCELAKAILGHKVGDTVTVKSNKQYDVKIIAISKESKNK